MRLVLRSQDSSVAPRRFCRSQTGISRGRARKSPNFLVVMQRMVGSKDQVFTAAGMAGGAGGEIGPILGGGLLLMTGEAAAVHGILITIGLGGKGNLPVQRAHIFVALLARDSGQFAMLAHVTLAASGIASLLCRVAGVVKD